MRKHSILTTIFPRLGFHNFSFDELDSYKTDNKQCPPFGCFIGQKKEVLYNGEVAEEKKVFYEDLIPPFRLGGRIIKTVLQYVEVSESHPRAKLSKSVATAEVKVFLHNDFSGQSGEAEYKEIKGSDFEFSHDYFREVITSEDFSCAEFNLIITLPTTENTPENKAKRKQLLASEVTTAYRRFITGILNMSLEHAIVNDQDQAAIIDYKCSLRRSRAAGVVNQSLSGQPRDLHATDEDAWRLVCGFGTIEEELRAFNRMLMTSNQGEHTINSLEKFLQSLCADKKQNSTAAKFLEHLFEKRHISKDISLRKVTEFFIYERLSGFFVRDA